jgi:platelet-activating factor acetylhydrolase
VTPASGSGKAIIDRCMTDESILQTELLKEMPNDHRPDDQWIAARLRVDHEFKKRMVAGVQRKVKRNFQGGMGTGYTTSDEVWSHFKPTEEQLEKWINEEHRGETRIDEKSAMEGNPGDATDDSADSSGLGSCSIKDGQAISQSEADEGQRPATASAATAENTSNDAPQDTWLGVLPALRDGPQQA